MITPFNNNGCPAERLYNTPPLRFGERPFFYPAERSEASPLLAPPRGVPCVAPRRQPRGLLSTCRPERPLFVAPSVSEGVP